MNVPLDEVVEKRNYYRAVVRSLHDLVQAERATREQCDKLHDAERKLARAESEYDSIRARYERKMSTDSQMSVTAFNYQRKLTAIPFRSPLFASPNEPQGQGVESGNSSASLSSSEMPQRTSQLGILRTVCHRDPRSKFADRKSAKSDGI